MPNNSASFVPLPTGRTSLQLGGVLLYVPGWLPAAAADSLLEETKQRTAFEPETMSLSGRPVLQTRLTGWIALRFEASSGYRRSMPAPMPGPHLTLALHEVESLTQWRPNAILVNRYPDGGSSLGWHADDKMHLAPKAPIVSISLGAPRDFLLKPKDATKGIDRYRAPLGHGDLLIMWDCQTAYQHCVPKRSTAGERINLTARQHLN